MGGAAKKYLSFTPIGLWNTAVGKPVVGALKNSLFPSVPKAPALPMSGPNADVQAAMAAEEERARQTRRRGQPSTILTGPLGDTSTPDLARRVLLGSG